MHKRPLGKLSEGKADLSEKTKVFKITETPLSYLTSLNLYLLSA